MHLQAGQILAEKYRIVRLLGQGGMGAVYEGENTRIRRRVAIKTLHGSVSSRADVVQRFEREAQAAGRIGSDHIVEVLDMGDLPDGTRFMVMEFLEGVTLGERIVKRGRIPPRELVPILTQMLEGLSAAHAASIIHRDLKPANVFLLTQKGGQSDFVKILDFGVSKFSALNAEEMSMTRTGAVVGTPYYMSPEQAKGARSLDARSDLYAVGVILYEAITGQVPFNAETFNELIFKIALESPPPPEQFVPNLDPAFSAIVRRAMARDVGERFQSADELKEALLAWAADFDRRVASGAISPQGGVGASTQVLPMMPHPGSQGSAQLGPMGTVPLQGMTEAAQALAAQRRAEHQAQGLQAPGAGAGAGALPMPPPAPFGSPAYQAQGAYGGAPPQAMLAQAPAQRSSGLGVAIGLGALAAVLVTAAIGAWFFTMKPLPEPPEPHRAPARAEASSGGAAAHEPVASAAPVAAPALRDPGTPSELLPDATPTPPLTPPSPATTPSPKPPVVRPPPVTTLPAPTIPAPVPPPRPTATPTPAPTQTGRPISGEL
jgi:eukaryotic-like serine/threonine-protein kinase